jgi:hypothetical protein
VHALLLLPAATMARAVLCSAERDKVDGDWPCARVPRAGRAEPSAVQKAAAEPVVASLGADWLRCAEHGRGVETSTSTGPRAPQWDVGGAGRSFMLVRRGSGVEGRACGACALSGVPVRTAVPQYRWQSSLDYSARATCVARTAELRQSACARSTSRAPRAAEANGSLQPPLSAFVRACVRACVRHGGSL